MKRFPQAMVSARPEPYWIATLAGSGIYGYEVAFDAQGNLYLAGDSTNSRWLVAKYDRFGALVWQKEFTPGTARGRGIAVDASGNVYVIGLAQTNAAVLIKLDASGAIVWQVYLGSTSTWGYDVETDASGNVYIACYTTAEPGSGLGSAVAAKYNGSGVLQWQRRLSPSVANDYASASSIALDGSGNVYIGGYSAITGGTNSEFLVAKYNNAGTLQWQRKLGGATNDQGRGLAVTSAGDVYLTGYSDDGSGTGPMYLAKYDTSGAIQWQKKLDGAGLEAGEGLDVDALGNVYLVGQTTSASLGSSDFIIVKYNSAGTIQWQRRLGDANSNVGLDIAVNAAGDSFCVIGYTGSTQNVLMAKLPTDGTRTGTYGGWTYAATTLTASSGSLTDAASTLTAATATLATGTATLTAGATTFTSTTTNI